jgi:hypothetical protein
LTCMDKRAWQQPSSTLGGSATQYSTLMRTLLSFLLLHGCVQLSGNSCRYCVRFPLYSFSFQVNLTCHVPPAEDQRMCCTLPLPVLRLWPTAAPVWLRPRR